MTRAFAVTLFALLIASPVQAATIQWDLNNVTGNNGQLIFSGFFDLTNGNLSTFDITANGVTPEGLILGGFSYTNALLVGGTAEGAGVEGNEVSFSIPSDGATKLDLLVANISSPFQSTGPLQLIEGSQFFAAVGPPQMGPETIALSGELVSAVPLPTALPLFSIALAGLGIMRQINKRRIAIT